MLSRRPVLATQLNTDWPRKATVASGSLLRVGVSQGEVAPRKTLQHLEAISVLRVALSAITWWIGDRVAGRGAPGTQCSLAIEIARPPSRLCTLRGGRRAVQ